MRFNLKLQGSVKHVTKRVQGAMDAGKRKVLRRMGAYVRKIARDFVKHKRNPNQSAAPLHSPYDHFGLKRSIEFGVDNDYAYIGPKYIKRGLANVARVHEFGGNVVANDVNPELIDGVEPGQVAPVTSKYFNKKKDTLVRKEAHIDPKTKRNVFWIRIRTATQAKHSTRLYRRLNKAYPVKKLKHYPPRPYMRPALYKALPHLTPMWKNSIKA